MGHFIGKGVFFVKIGYIRVSTQEQNTMRQEALMEALGVDEVYIDRMSLLFLPFLLHCDYFVWT